MADLIAFEVDVSFPWYCRALLKLAEWCVNLSLLLLPTPKLRKS